MKKITLLLACAVGNFVYSQSNSERIQDYLNKNASKNKLSNQEAKDWILENTTTSETTGIDMCTVKQTYNGIEVYQSNFYFWIKKGEIINTPANFINNLSSKTNSVVPVLSVTEAFSKVLAALKEEVFSTSIVEKKNNTYKITNGKLTEDHVNARLVYYKQSEKNYVLAWSYEFYSQDSNHLWSIVIDATSGKILKQKDLVVRCGFSKNRSQSEHNHLADKKGTNSFIENIFKPNAFTLLTPGTTNYKVVPYNYESPNHYKAAFPASPDGRTTVTNPEATTALAPSVNAASPNGWHNATSTPGPTLTYSYTRGNNVWANSDFTDADNTNPSTYANASSGSYPSLTFDYPYGGTSVDASTYINAALTNLFYMNNVMHDFWYQYGFDEANRNFQNANYNRGGSGGDYVFADAQDGSQKGVTATTGPDLNNANFYTPIDGSRPRMQMYLWTTPPANSTSFTVNSPAGIAGIKPTYDNNFTMKAPYYHVFPPAAGLTKDLVLVVDGAAPTSDGCTAITNTAALNGKIAVIRRGSCNFTVKVENAQTAGAVAVLVVNNDSANPTAPIIMGGNDASPYITIPAFSVNYQEGEAIIAAMSSGTVNATMKGPSPTFVAVDGDLDNGIISHEYGHGISTRLVGGGGGLNSAEQPGEGWSDWFALMMHIKPGDTRNDARGIGTFAISEPTNGHGIREYMYSTDMAVNPHTYGNTNTQWYTDSQGVDQIDVHGVGTIWCAMLWDLAWNYIDKYGYDSNLYNGTGGNNKVMRLVIDALKLTPANPSFIEARDAIIAADQATTGGQNFCLIWSTFARRGLGTGASAGSNNDVVSDIQDQTESFAEPAPGPNCTLANTSFETDYDFRVFPNPSNGLINIHVNNLFDKVNLQIVDLNGRVVFSQENIDFNSEKSFNLSHLQAGVYVVKLNGEKLNLTRKIILK